MASSVESLDTVESNVMKEGKLYEVEFFWRDHYLWLKEHGYTLRSRYRPGWVASWLNSPWKGFFAAEDGIAACNVFQIMDATRADGTVVALKQIEHSVHPNEAAIGQLFSSEPFSSDPRNHCIPILDVLHSPDDENTILVMPILYDNEIPPFETVGEVVEFFRQIFEGLQFMHTNHISHRDCKYNNIMADVAPLYKSRPHPWHPWRTYDYSKDVKKRSSRTRTPIKYYLVDFGLSKIYKPENAPHLEPPAWGGDKTVPEFQTPERTPCDPFPVDVYCLGNAIRKNFLDCEEDMPTAKEGFEFMRQLIDDMVNKDPKQRPTMDEVVLRFDAIVMNLSSWQLRSRVVELGERPIRGMARAIVHWTKQLVYMARQIPPVPKA
ncbi:hypothetical protein Hypma_007479 [Hypsizygus marmoreus]|uniref:Protein kinase domain-containing protein n=1 Tax=Hypsizygus marmoreus TaxID=39966 RepID=A0A369JVG5_HYPMA|nr:hypothetical protein Hypma_007479 [Hypsizygus marmoreus]